MTKSADWHAQRTDAERVACPHCHAPAGTTCRNTHTGRPIHGLPAHTPRSMRARTTPRTPQDRHTANNTTNRAEGQGQPHKNA